jgi:ribonuclease PH
MFKQNPMREHVAATSVGILNGEILLDLCYEEDSRAEVDANVVMTASGGLIEVQSTAERAPFTREQMDTMLDFAAAGITELFEHVRAMEQSVVGLE